MSSPISIVNGTSTQVLADNLLESIGFMSSYSEDQLKDILDTLGEKLKAVERKLVCHDFVTFVPVISSLLTCRD